MIKTHRLLYLLVSLVSLNRAIFTIINIPVYRIITAFKSCG